VTDAAEHEGLAATRRHDAHPERLLLLATRREIRKLAHVVDLNILRSGSTTIR
jgi:hypothetical protein